jgi:hypothetical protein
MSDNLTIELLISDNQAEVVLGKNRQRFNDFVNEVKSKPLSLKFTVPNQGFIDLDKLEKRADAIRKSFQSIAATRLDAGQVNNLTREIVKAHECSGQLERDIKSIKAELQKPNRKSSIAFLTDELRAAEKEADSLTRKLSALPDAGGVDAGGRSSTGSKTARGRRKGLTDTQRTVLELTDDFAPEGFNRPFNAVAGELLKINTLGATSLATFGSIAVVGAALVKISYDIRNDAEVRLKTEEKIAATLNKQRLEAQELKKAFEEQRKEAALIFRFKSPNWL